MDTREEIEFIEKYGYDGVRCDRCGEPTRDREQYEEVLGGLYCQDCAEIERGENTPEMYCDMCGFYFMEVSDKCPNCGEVDCEVFYTLSIGDLEEYWENGGEVW